VPKLWSETIATHRHAVQEAILDATWALVTEHGLLSVTMSQIAEEAGVGRATLYKYFPDVEAILVAWHERQTAVHLTELTRLARREGDAGEQLRAVLQAYARICHHRGGHSGDLGALLHRGPQLSRIQQQLVDLVGDLLSEAAAQGHVRDDTAPAELASYCVHALGAAGALPSETAVHRLVNVILDGLRPPS
jgi:AcrR family transcriptional regulator